MATNRLTWNAAPAEEDGYRVYRSTAALDLANLPAPIGEVPPGRGVFEDTGATDGTLYHYRVAAFAGGQSAIGDEFQVAAKEAMPRLVYASPLTSSDSRSEVTATIPACQPGDVLVAFGIRRGVVDTPVGWTSAGDVPDGSYPQWTYALWKVADGSESGTPLTVAYTDGAAARLSLTVAVLRHPTKPINVSTLALQREATGPSASNPLAVTNGPTRALLLVAFGWVYAATSGDTFVQNWSSRAMAPGPCRLPADPFGPLRHMALLTEASAAEAVSLTYETDSSNDVDSRSNIWLAFTV